MSGIQLDLLTLSEGHFAVSAIAGDFEECRASFQEEVSRKAIAVLALEASSQLPTQTVSGVHQRC